MRIKRFTLFFMALLMIVMSFGACAPKAETPVQTEQPTSQNTTADTPKDSTEDEVAGGYNLPLVDEPVTLVFMNADTQSAGASFGDGKALSIIEAEKKTGVKIKWELIPNSEYNDVLNLRLASRQDLPDIIRLKGGQEGTFLAQALDNKTIIPLNEYIEKYGMGYRRIMEENPVVRTAVTLPDGSIAGFHKIDATQYAYAAQMIRQDWLDNLGMAMPTTLDEFLDVAIAFTKNDPDKNGENDTYGIHCANPSGNMFEYNQLASAFGIGLCTGSGWSARDGKITYEWVLPEAKEYLKWFRKVVEAGVLPPDYTSVTYPEHDARVASGKVGLIPRGWPMNIIEWNNPQHSMKINQPDARWAVVPALKAENVSLNQARIIKEPTVRRNNALAITSACKNPEIAYKWLDWVHYSEEGILLNNCGIEGETYEINGDELVLLDSDLSTNRPRADGTWWGREYVELYNDNRIVEAGFKRAGLSLGDNSIQQILANSKYLVEPFYPAIPSIESGKELTTLLTEIGTYKDEMWVKFCNGSISIDDKWDEYVDRINQLGLSRVLEIYQQGYDMVN